MAKVTYVKQPLPFWWSIRTTISFQTEARFGIALRPLQKQMDVFLICCRF